MKPWARKQIKGVTSHRKKKTRTIRSCENANMERTTRDEPLAKGKGSYFDSRVSIEITHYRCRLCDPGGPSSKALVDGLVNCGILRDDSLLWIAEPIIERQVKVKNYAEEKTVILIEEVERPWE